MLTRLLTAFFALATIALFTLPSSAIESIADRRARQQQAAQSLPNDARAALNDKKPDLAIELYTRAIDSRVFDSNPLVIGEIYFGRGLAYRMKGNCPLAISDLDAASKFISKGDVYYARALCRLDLGQEDAALADLELAIKTDPLAADYHHSRCILLFNRKNFVGALPDCETALVAKPQDKNLILAASQAAEQTGNRARAAELYRKLLAIEPGNPVATEGLKRVGG